MYIREKKKEEVFFRKTSGINATLDGKTYLTRYVIEEEAPAGSAAVTTKDARVTADVVLSLAATGAVLWNSSGPFAYNFNATLYLILIMEYLDDGVYLFIYIYLFIYLDNGVHLRGFNI
jgi:hypothetical protein